MLLAGKNGKAARRLKDVQLSDDKMCKAYFDCVMYMRMMYQRCKLVHGDLSEYNMLYLHGTLYIIDVSQAVDLDHPNALEFLRRDAANVNDFFHKKGVNTMTVRQLFDFCVDESIGDKVEEAEKYLMQLQSRVVEQTITAEDEVEAAVFQQAFIPQNLSQIEEKHFLVILFFIRRPFPFLLSPPSFCLFPPFTSLLAPAFTLLSPPLS